MSVPVPVAKLGAKVLRAAGDALKSAWIKEQSNEWALYAKRQELKTHYQKWVKSRKKAGEAYGLAEWKAYFKSQQEAHDETAIGGA